MAGLSTTRAVLCARSVLRRAVPQKFTSPATNGATQDTSDDLCSSFRHLTLSPVEAQLSQIVASAGTLNKTTELRLPPLLKPPTITFPALYNGVLLEKDLPSVLTSLEIIDPRGPKQIVESPSNQVVEKQAARLIVIRRRKMKKHKLKKLRKKMRFVMLKRRQKREYKKEKLFQAGEMAKVREYEAFDAAQYARDLLHKTIEKPEPRFWTGTQYPESLVKELMEKRKQKKLKRIQNVMEQKELQKIIDNYKPFFTK